MSIWDESRLLNSGRCRFWTTFAVGHRPHGFRPHIGRAKRRRTKEEEEIAAEMRAMRDEAAMGGGKTASAGEIFRDPLLWKPILVGIGGR